MSAPVRPGGDRPCRSLLYIPGNAPGLIQHCPAYGSDGVLLDLEDAVALSEKDAARELTARFLERLDFGDLVVTVRINGADTPFFEEDLRRIVPLAPHAVRLPKCGGPEDVEAVDRRIGEIERASGLPEGTVAIHAMLETALGIENAFAVARSSRRVRAQQPSHQGHGPPEVLRPADRRDQDLVRQQWERAVDEEVLPPVVGVHGAPGRVQVLRGGPGQVHVRDGHQEETFVRMEQGEVVPGQTVEPGDQGQGEEEEDPEERLAPPLAGAGLRRGPGAVGLRRHASFPFPNRQWVANGQAGQRSRAGAKGPPAASRA